jgi:protein-arginine kinase activator protein McsA
MEVQIICRYCDHKIVKNIHNQTSTESMVCDKCGDGDLTFKDLSKTKIDSYAGAPAFPEKIQDDLSLPPGYPWNMGND